MSGRSRRLLLLVSIPIIAAVAVVGGALAGAATAPARPAEPAAVVAGGAPVAARPAAERPGNGHKAGAFRRHAAIGIVAAVDPDHTALTVGVRSQEEPIHVAVGETTAVKINRRTASFGEIEPGDRVMVFGRPDSDGNVVARAVMVRRAGPPPAR